MEKIKYIPPWERTLNDSHELQQKRGKKVKKVKIIVPIIIILIILISIIIGAVIINSNNKTYELEKVEKYSYFKLYQNDKYGVIDDKGNTIIEPKYDTVNIPNPAKALFICYYDYNDNEGEYKTKVLNEKNEEILTQFEQVLPLICEESTSNIPFEKSALKYKENGKYGIIDFSGKKITKPIYDDIESLKYREGSLIVKKEEKYGVINIKGKTILKAQYDGIKSDEYYTEENDYQESGFIIQNKTEEGYRYGYADKNGKEVLEIKYNEIERITDIKENQNAYLLISKNGKYGVVQNKNIIIENVYEEIEYNKTNQIFIVQKNSKQGVISKEGKEVLLAQYDYILCTGNRITTKKGESVEIYNAKGEKQNSRYDNIIDTGNEEYIITIDENEQFGVINKSGQILIENKYQYIEYAFENYFIVTQEGKVGVINTNNEIKIEPTYDTIQRVKDKKILQAIISSTNTIEMYNRKIEKQVSIKEAVLYSYNNYIKLISNNEMKYLDNNGNTISNKELLPNNKLFAYNKDGKWGFIDRNDNIVLQPKYDIVTEFNNYGFAGIKENGQWGVIDEQCNIIVQPSYKIDWNDPDFIGPYCKLNFGYGFEYYTNELTK